MNVLPVIQRNKCLPRCGECCGGTTPVIRSEVDKIIETLNGMSDRAVTKQLRFWGGAARWCPFLTRERTCFIYDSRPEVCRAFGHMKPDLACPYEAEGKVAFDEWGMDEAVRFAEVTKMHLDMTSVIPLAGLGLQLIEALKRGDGRMTVIYFTAEQYRSLQKAVLKNV